MTNPNLVEAINAASIDYQLPGKRSGAEAFIEALARRGFVIVPVEPTQEMINAGFGDCPELNIAARYAAMIAAA
jgi:hypothetical protein